ncbi:hypothetical protein [Kurthia sibirica]|uniref:Glycosyl hydrolase lipoprotein n=1 Tax=Kurthia sibirica TaxID=202750 RepID=A0A2U3ANG3_9BACL|nr:hypothetical protein [Kurthia sibirica]PWI26046.1 hypothetical protein DEX24_05820 [Kurthia sibirica]GEK34553.1 putative lipoprotein YdaJ [Kurthia sibirica]
MKFITVFMSIFLLVGCVAKPQEEIHYNLPKTANKTALFINEYLVADNGLIKTNLSDRENDYLSESMGLWLCYLESSNQQKNFKLAVDALTAHMLLKNNLVSWQVKGEEQEKTNAFIDDARIVGALVAANKRWGDNYYMDIAQKIMAANIKYTMNGDFFVDFASKERSKKATTIMISYLMPQELTDFMEAGQLTSAKLAANLAVLKKTPTDSTGYFAKNYDVTNDNYHFSKNVHMVDQLLTAINIEQVKGNTTAFDKNIRLLIKRDGKLYGQYKRANNQATVAYESPAVYGYALQYFHMKKEEEMVGKIHRKLRSLQQLQKKDKYYGGFIDTTTKATHAFDNLLPLLTEGSYIDE